MIKLSYNLSGNITEIGIIILYLAIIFATLYLSLYTFLKYNGKEYRALFLLACCFLVSGLVQYFPALNGETLGGKRFIQIVGITFEIAFLSNFFCILLDKKIKWKYLTITAILISSPVLLTIENKGIFDYKDGFIWNIYYAVFCFLTANLIFIFLIFNNQLFTDIGKTNKSIIQILFGLLIYYIFKISNHTSLAYLKYEDVHQLNQRILLIHILDSMAMLTNLIGFILLTIFLKKDILNRDIEARKT